MKKKAEIDRRLIKKVLDELISSRDKLSEAGDSERSDQVQVVIRSLCDELEEENNQEVEYTNPMEFYPAVLSYAQEIGGKVLRTDKPPYIGYVVFKEEDGKEIARYFMIKAQNLKAKNWVRDYVAS